MNFFKISDVELNKGSFFETAFDGQNVIISDGYEKGEYISPFIQPQFYFKEAIPSVNIICKLGASFKIDVEFGDNIWQHLGSWGRYSNRAKTSDILNFDYFNFEKPVKKCRFKISLFASSKGVSPIIKSLNMAFSKEIFTDKKFSLDSAPIVKKSLPVPFRSQFWEDPSFCAQICSATSIAMVMQYYGKNIATSEIVKKVYDPDFKMYGLWWRSAQAASEYGLISWVQYFENWKECENFISKGIPVIACTAYEKDELPGAPAEFSQGHIIVICGFDDKGNPICRDSAGRDEKTGILTYDREKFGKVWFSNAGGVGYIIHE